jgi:hypothetical protein
MLTVHAHPSGAITVTVAVVAVDARMPSVLDVLTPQVEVASGASVELICA